MLSLHQCFHFQVNHHSAFIAPMFSLPSEPPIVETICWLSPKKLGLKWKIGATNPKASPTNHPLTKGATVQKIPLKLSLFEQWVEWQEACKSLGCHISSRVGSVLLSRNQCLYRVLLSRNQCWSRVPLSRNQCWSRLFLTQTIFKVAS